MRTRKKKWTAGELDNNPLIMRGDAPVAVAGGARAFHLELGCGKGRFITEMARLNPDIRYIGVERDPTILAAAARKAFEAASEPPNVSDIATSIDSVMPFTHATINFPAFIIAEASELTSIFTSGSIARLYINFCDPWPNKKKWAKRRLTHGNFLKLYEELLIPEIFFKTDNRQLFEFSIESLSARGWKLRNVSLDLHAGEMPDNVMTEYEEKFSSKGMPIYRLEAYK